MCHFLMIIDFILENFANSKQRLNKGFGTFHHFKISQILINIKIKAFTQFVIRHIF